MANEISESVALGLANGTLNFQVAYESKTVTQNAALVIAKTVSVTTAEANIDTTGITTLGICYIKNIDPTNYVKAGPSSGGAMVEAIRLKPGEENLFRLAPGVTWRWVADTATCKVYIVVLND